MFQRKRLQQMHYAHNPVALRTMLERCPEPRVAPAQVASQMPFESREWARMLQRCSQPRVTLTLTLSAQVANQMPFESRERARMLATTSSADRLKFQLNRLQQTDSENCCIM